MCRHVVDASKKSDEVPTSLMARMIKYRILKQRMMDIAAKEKAKVNIDCHMHHQV